jgi:serine/threonine-protein kinase
MELLQGEELAALIKQRRALPLEEAFILLRQAAVALDKTHAAGIVHRDLKPENMFVTFRDDGSPCIKILDFGIAKVVVSSNQARATRPMGTPLYMAPEQILGEGDLGPRTDLFALGHIAYTLLTGESYWAEETKQSASLYPLLSKILNGIEEMPSARAARRNCVALPEGFDLWFLRATAVRPEDRFQRAVDMVAALSNAMRIPMPRPSSPSTEIWGPGMTIPGAPPDLPLGTAARTGEPVGTVPLSTELLDWSTSDGQGTGPRPSRTDMASVAASKNTPVASPAHRRAPKAVPLAVCALALAGVATAGIIVVKPDRPNPSGGAEESTDHVTTKAPAQTAEAPPPGGGAPTASTEPLVTAVPAVEMASPTSTFQLAAQGAAMVTAQPTVAVKPSKKPAQAPAGGREAHKPATSSPLPQDAPPTSPPPKKERPGIY